MAKTQNLAGLAALGALGYMMARGGKQDGSNVPVEDRGDMPVGVGMTGGSAEEETSGSMARTPAPVRNLAAQAVSPRMETPPETVARVGASAMSKGRREMIRNPQRGPAFSDIEGMRAERATNDRLNQLTREMNRGQLGKVAASGYQNPQRGPSFEEIQQKNEQDRIDALRSSGGMRAKGGMIKAKKMASGGMTSKASSASKRADGIAQRGKTRGRVL